MQILDMGINGVALWVLPNRFSMAHGLFSFHSHRLRILLLLCAYFYITTSLRMAMSTGIVCMINQTAVGSIHKARTGNMTNGCAMEENVLENEERYLEGDIEWTPSQQSFVLSSNFYGSFLTVCFAGMICDRVGSKRMLMVIGIMMTVTTLLTPFMSHVSYEMTVIFRIFSGMGEGATVPAMSALVSNWFPAFEKSTAASIFTSGSQLAGAFSSLIAGKICRSTTLGGWPSIFYVFGGITIVVLVIWQLIVSDHPSTSRWTSDEEKIFLSERVPQKEKKGKKDIPWLAIMSSSPVHSIFFCSFAFGYSTSTMQAYLPTYLTEHLYLDLDAVAVYTLTPFIAQLLSKNSFGPFMDYAVRNKMINLNRATQIAQSFGSFGSSLALIGVAFLPTCHTPWWALVLLIIYGFVYSGGMCGFFMSLLSIAPSLAGTISSMSMLFTMLGSCTASVIVTTCTSLESPYKWEIVFCAGAIFQMLSGFHFQVYGTCSEQEWARNASKVSLEKKNGIV